MQITLKTGGKTEKMETKAKCVEHLLKEIGINTESVLVKNNGRFVPAEDEIRTGDFIEVIKITSSG